MGGRAKALEINRGSVNIITPVRHENIGVAI
jgi:hypothetical protein